MALDLRKEALDVAIRNHGHLDAERIVTRAEAFYDFLTKEDDVQGDGNEDAPLTVGQVVVFRPCEKLSDLPIGDEERPVGDGTAMVVVEVTERSGDDLPHVYEVRASGNPFQLTFNTYGCCLEVM